MKGAKKCGTTYGEYQSMQQVPEGQNRKEKNGTKKPLPDPDQFKNYYVK